MNKGDGHVIFNGRSRLLKCYIYGEGTPRHEFECHDVGINDADVTAGMDIYGQFCKCPPGIGYILGIPDNEKAIPYGFHFTPIMDDPHGDMRLHNRAGIGIHGGGSASPNPFAPRQGFYDTEGCLRLQNEDNQEFVAYINGIHKANKLAYLDVIWA